LSIIVVADDFLMACSPLTIDESWWRRRFGAASPAHSIYL
jgi:hypothetical protein